jgi:hypothetical protein
LEQEILMDYLARRKKKSFYEIDGLVIIINGEYERNVADNPKYSVWLRGAMQPPIATRHNMF